MFWIPEDEIHIDFVRSSGAGGQNVNKTATKAQLRFRIGDSRVFFDEQKQRIRKVLYNRLNNNDEIIPSSSAERSQAQNKASVIKRFYALLKHALVIPKRRKATKPSRASKQFHLDTKKYVSRLKKLRGRVDASE